MIDRLKECLSYDPETGVLRWKKRRSNVPAGSIAGCLDHRGYRLVRVNGHLMLAHRIAWVLHHGAWPDGDIDHRNLDKGNNRIENLRLAQRPHNNANSPSRSRKGLPKGCYQLKGRKNWYSKIMDNGKVRRLGYFATVEEAAAAFQQAHKQIHGEFSRCEARHG